VAFAAAAELSIKPPVNAKRAPSDLASVRSLGRFGLSGPEFIKAPLFAMLWTD
jgi:hypothetical protein